MQVFVMFCSLTLLDITRLVSGDTIQAFSLNMGVFSILEISEAEIWKI